MDKEIFKDIKGYEGRYKVSNLGRIFKKTEKNPFYEFVLVKPTLSDSNGNELAILLGERKQEILPISNLVADAFLLKPKDCSYVKHINNNMQDNRVSNLKWVKSK